MREENAARRRLVVIELGQECAEHFARFERTIGTRKIRAIAPVLPGAKEEHFDARVAALLVHGEYIRLVDAAWIDALMRLDGGKRGETIAIDRGALEIEQVRRLLHFAGEFLLP